MLMFRSTKCDDLEILLWADRERSNFLFFLFFSPGFAIAEEMASVADHLVFASVAELVVKLVKPVDSRSPCNSCGQICPQISPNILL